MRILFYILLTVFFTSCNGTNDEVYYSYNDVVIKRIDTNGKSKFYFMKNGEETEKIWAEYSGINDGFSGYLKFEENSKVLILEADGYFQTDNIDNLNFKIESSIDETNFDSPKICKIWYPIEAEQEKNKTTKTKVEIKYIRH